jgi:hypothetical protein
MDSWAHQNHISKTRPRNLSNTLYQPMVQPSHMDHIKEGAPNSGVWWHPTTHRQTIQCVSYTDSAPRASVQPDTPA